MISSGTLHVPRIVIGVDTHKDEHVAVVIDKLGARIGQQNLPTTNTGYVGLEHWARDFGRCWPGCCGLQEGLVSEMA